MSTGKPHMSIDIRGKFADRLRNELCVTLGFCFSQDRYARIIENLPSDLAIVVNKIFIAEEMNPELADRNLWRQVRDLVLKAHHDSAANDA